ncbi:MAG TPA: S-layer homology domain-containing protein [Firmicutes bacterium]|nr:S-layer homology domain-containing protein [Candidatus Fermentithermobacillaceae bacterium]
MSCRYSQLQRREAGQWYTAAVNWASANWIVEGYPDGRFGVGDNVTRKEKRLQSLQPPEHKSPISGLSNLS